MTIAVWISAHWTGATAALAGSITVAAASRGGRLRELYGMQQVATTGWRLLALGYAVFIAFSTLLPTGTDLWLFVFDVEMLAPPRIVGKLVVIAAFVDSAFGL